jgi:hypothetical protein
MTNYVVTGNQLNQVLSGVDDTLLVTSTGNITCVGLIENIGVASEANDQQIVDDGLIYGADIGMFLTGSNTDVQVNGSVQGMQGIKVILGGASESITVGNQGSVDGIAGNAIALVNDTPSAFTFNTVTNQGTISSMGNAGIYSAGGGNDSFSNSGTISGATGIELQANASTEYIENSGTIVGTATNGAAISSSQLTGTTSLGIHIINSGLLTNNADGGVLAFDDGVNGAVVTSSIDNSGTITGNTYAIVSLTDALDIANSGTIHGSLSSYGYVTLNNLGSWQAGTDALATSGSDDLRFGGGGAVTNSGNIAAAITMLAASGSSINTLTNTGTITGDISLSGTGVMKNHHEIYGDVTLGASDTLLNTGIIHGDVTLGASDTINDSRGEITGGINAASNDLFLYSGHFGQETINNFAASDIIKFAANDFGSLGSVLGSTKQVGADSVITLDATDTITLVGVAKSSLTAVNFSFT